MEDKHEYADVLGNPLFLGDYVSHTVKVGHVIKLRVCKIVGLSERVTTKGQPPVPALRVIAAELTEEGAEVFDKVCSIHRHDRYCIKLSSLVVPEDLQSLMAEKFEQIANQENK